MNSLGGITQSIITWNSVKCLAVSYVITYFRHFSLHTATDSKLADTLPTKPQ